MSRIEVPTPKIDGLGGSFSRNVKIGERGLGMLYDGPGDIFHLKAVWKDSQGAGTPIAPGTFEFIYFREEFDGNTYINRISSGGVWIQVAVGRDGKGDIEMSRIEDLLEDEASHDLVIEAPNPDRPVVTEVVLKKWGKFTDLDGTYSRKMKQLFDRDQTIPTTKIEDEFNEAIFPQQN